MELGTGITNAPLLVTIFPLLLLVYFLFDKTEKSEGSKREQRRKKERGREGKEGGRMTYNTASLLTACEALPLQVGSQGFES